MPIPQTTPPPHVRVHDRAVRPPPRGAVEPTPGQPAGRVLSLPSPEPKHLWPVLEPAPVISPPLRTLEPFGQRAAAARSAPTSSTFSSRLPSALAMHRSRAPDPGRRRSHRRRRRLLHLRQSAATGRHLGPAPARAVRAVLGEEEETLCTPD